MAQTHLLQPVKKAQDLQLSSPAVPLPVITAGHEDILACVMIKMLYQVTALSAAPLPINISC